MADFEVLYAESVPDAMSDAEVAAKFEEFEEMSLRYGSGSPLPAKPPPTRYERQDPVSE